MKPAFSEFPRLNQFISYAIHTSVEENEHTRLTERIVSKTRHEQSFHRWYLPTAHDETNAENAEIKKLQSPTTRLLVPRVGNLRGKFG
jgi:hypothetical protein